MLFAMSSPCDPFFLAAFTSSLEGGVHHWAVDLVQHHLHALCNVVPVRPLLLGSLHQLTVQLVRKKRFRKFSEVELQRSGNHRGIGATIECPPFVLINFNPNLLDLGSVSRNSIEPIRLEVFLRRLQFPHRLPDKRWDLDNLPSSCAALIELLFM